MSTLESNCDGNSSDSVYGSYSFIHGHKPCEGNSSSLDSIPDTKCWLNHHGLETGGENQLIDEYYYTYAKNDTSFCSDVPLKHLTHSHCKNNAENRFQEFESTIGDDLLSNVLLPGCSEMDSHWIRLKKIEPWWDAVDKYDLASLVFTRASSHDNRNCDHRGMVSMRVEKVLDGCEICFDQFEEQMKDRSVGKRVLMECMLLESDGTFSRRDNLDTSKLDSSNTHEPNSDLNRAQLLEALCHSQTRARKAEKSAQDACDEKDDIINLFFQQSLCLFAYRQWLRLLQLETLCLHLRSQDRPANPVFLSQAKSKGTALRKNGLCATKMKRAKTRCHISKCAVAFAVGFGLASAGLLVGWTIGWLFPGL